jgi:branched-chain amino acid transport system permease protein
MSVFPQFIINVLIPASLFGIVAVGFSLVTRVTRMYHLAIGGFMLLSGYLLYSSRLLGLPWALGIFLAIAVTGFSGWAVGRVVFERFYGRRRVRLGSSIVAALALLVFLENGLLMYYGPASKSVVHPWNTHHTIGGGAIITSVEIAIIIISLVCMGVLWAFLRHARLGKALRAVSDNAEVAAVVGIDVRRGRSMVWMIASLCAGIAGVLYALEYTLIPAQASSIAIRAFFRATLGGVGSVPGAMIGSLLLEAAEQATALWISSAFKFLAVALIVVVVLLWKPAGLFGKK